MTLDSLLAELVLAYGVELGDRAEIYKREFADLPLPLLTEGIRRTIRTRQTRGAFPSIAEILEDVEACRVLQAPTERSYEGCPRCEQTPGWIEISDDVGVRRMHRCDCRVQQRPPTPTLPIEDDTPISGTWTDTRAIASSPKVARFRRRVGAEPERSS